MNDLLQVALSELDPENNEHWTFDDQPKLEVLSSKMGERVTRKDVLAVDPLFTRESLRGRAPEAPAVDPLDELREKLAAARAKLADEMRDVARASSAVTRARREVDVLIVELDSKVDPREAALRRTKDLIAQSNEDRARRVKIMQERARLEPIDPSSPLDQALRARPRTRNY